jgi:hypothetical protein
MVPNELAVQAGTDNDSRIAGRCRNVSDTEEESRDGPKKFGEYARTFIGYTLRLPEIFTNHLQVL